MHIKQKRALRVNFSITRRSAICAALVIASASSRMISLGALVNICLVPAKSLIFSRTTSMPRSSDAFSSSTIDAYDLLYILCAHAMMVDVLPVPGGP